MATLLLEPRSPNRLRRPLGARDDPRVSGDRLEPSKEWSGQALRSLPPFVRRTVIGKPSEKVLERTRVYLGRLREVRSPATGPHAGWTFVEDGSRPAHPSPPADRNAYVVQLRDVPMCRYAISCPTGPEGRASEFDFFVDVGSRRNMGSLGLPSWYDPAHPNAEPPPSATRQ